MSWLTERRHLLYDTNDTSRLWSPCSLGCVRVYVLGSVSFPSLETAQSMNSLKSIWPPPFLSMALNSGKASYQISNIHKLTKLHILITFIPIFDFSHPLFYDWLDLLRGELCLRYAAVIVCVNPRRWDIWIIPGRGRQRILTCQRPESTQSIAARSSETAWTPWAQCNWVRICRPHCTCPLRSEMPCWWPVCSWRSPHISAHPEYLDPPRWILGVN